MSYNPNSSLPSGWSLKKLSELGKVGRGKSRHRPRHDPKLYGGAYPFIQTGDVKASGGRIYRHEQTYNENGLAQSRLWPTGTMCITIAANIAETAILTYPACFPDSVIGFIADQNSCDVRFIEYAFRAIKRELQHEAAEGGTVQDNINLETIERLRLPVPNDIKEQSRIADILFALDDKIELNCQINQALEEIAQTLFKSWFVDFDPVQAKRDGRKPFAMSSETAELFPSHFEDSEIGPIPQGWRKTNFSDEFEIIKGRSYKSSELAESDTALVTLKSFKRGGGYREDGLKSYIGGFKPQQIVKAGDLIVACTDVTQDAEVIGRAAIVLDSPNYKTLVASLDVLICRPRNQMNIAFGYGLLKTDDFTNYILGHANGTTVLHLSQDGLPSYSFACPPFSSSLLAIFEKITEPLFRQVHDNFEQNRTLAILRDTLLPKLLSGEIRIRDAERQIEAAI